MNASVQKKIKDFFIKFERFRYVKGKQIVTPGKIPEGIYCLTDGIVRCYALSKSGKELTINAYRPLSFFPMNLVMNKKQDRYYYEAQTPVTVFCAPVKEFEHFISENHDVSYDLLQRIYKGLDGYMMRMEALLSGDAYIKILTIILIHSLRFENKINNIVLSQPLSQSQIASQSGLSRETVTREIKKMQQKNLIGYRKKTLIVFDLSRLQQEIFE